MPESNSANADTITDFASLTDTLDFNAITAGVGDYIGEANDYAAVLTSLSAGGTAEGVLDTSTSTLYVDVDGNGVLDAADVAIDLTGVTAMDTADFIW